MRTFKGKEYSFSAEDCWQEGLEGLTIRRNRLFYLFSDAEITSPRGLAAVFYFIDIWESWPDIVFPTFDFLCGQIPVEDYVELMKAGNNHIKSALTGIDVNNCTRGQVMSAIEPYIPAYSDELIKPYIKFFEEVNSLGEIATIDITIY